MESNRSYISYSQFALFKSSPKAYYEKYALDKKSYGTKYQNFGKKLMEDLEFGEVKGVPKEMNLLVANNVVEFEMTVKPKFLDKNLFGIVDVIQSDYNKFWEIKTGKNAWTSSQVDKNEQMLFYALMINLKYGIIPTATLVWIETLEDEDAEGGVSFTGRIEYFYRQFTLAEIVAFEVEVLKVANEIIDYEHTVLEVDNSVDARLLKLLSEKKRVDEELELLKAEILLEIKEFENKYASSENFNITLAKRKNWDYSDDLNNEMKDVADHFKKLKANEEKSGKATFRETEYLLIKPKK